MHQFLFSVHLLKEKIKNTKSIQYLLGISSISIAALICASVLDTTEYHVVALILLLVVSVLAVFFDVLPIITVAILSALIWNFFFIPPKSTFNISTPQDALLFLMYFVIAIINGVFTSKIRKMETQAQERKEKERTLELYNTLFNSLSHELKTPIATILASADILKNQNDELTESTKKDVYTEIEIASKRLNLQVEHFLDMSRLDSKYIHLQKDWYDINEIILKLIRVKAEDAANHRIEYTPKEELPLIKADGTLLEQIIQNILHNALQYTPAGSTISIEVEVTDTICYIIIQDDGEGFPEDKLEKVFDKFYRLPNTNTGGTGLGLSIAKGFAKAHNGDIRLENVPTGGARFTVSIKCEMSYFKSLDDETS